MTTALIAEDEALLAEHLRAELARLWPELQITGIAPHGAAAVEMALAQRPDIAFLDIRMPGLSGLEAAEAIGEEWPQGETPPLLVFVTAYDQYALQAFEARRGRLRAQTGAAGAAGADGRAPCARRCDSAPQRRPPMPRSMPRPRWRSCAPPLGAPGLGRRRTRRRG